jgi:hypothetical protein
VVDVVAELETIIRVIACIPLRTPADVPIPKPVLVDVSRPGSTPFLAPIPVVRLGALDPSLLVRRLVQLVPKVLFVRDVVVVVVVTMAVEEE